MKKSISHLFQVSILIALLGTLPACSMFYPQEYPAHTSASKQAAEIYEVHHDGRIHVFYDHELYLEFLSLGETPYRLTRIGAGPKGETVVFGLTKKDKKKRSGIAAIDLYDGKIKAPENFYAEMVKHNRIYVFNNFRDMETVRSFGHPNYMYTRIGAGPKGETVVFVLNKRNNKRRPVTLIATYKNKQ